MTPLRQRMIADLPRRGLSERTQDSHSAPFFAVPKQFWQRLLKRGEDGTLHGSLHML